MDSEITAHLMDIKQSLVRIETKTVSLEDAVLGSERGPGLSQRVGALEKDRSKLWGIGLGITSFLGVFEYFEHFFKGNH